MIFIFRSCSGTFTILRTITTRMDQCASAGCGGLSIAQKAARAYVQIKGWFEWDRREHGCPHHWKRGHAIVFITLSASAI